jgi:hypothetical protein
VKRRRRHFEEREGVSGRDDGLGHFGRVAALRREQIQGAAIFGTPVFGDEVKNVCNAAPCVQDRWLALFYFARWAGAGLDYFSVEIIRVSPSVHNSKIAFMISTLTLIGFCIPIQVPNWYLIWRYC